MPIINVIALAAIAGVVFGFTVSAAAPRFTISVLTGLGFYAKGSLTYEKYEHVDTRNYKSTRSRYLHLDKESFKKEVTGAVRVFFLALLLLVFEIIAVSLYYLFK